MLWEVWDLVTMEARIVLSEWEIGRNKNNGTKTERCRPS